MKPNRSKRPLMALLVLLAGLTGGISARAQVTNAASAAAAKDYSAYRVIADRNIFNPERYAHSGRNRGKKKMNPALPTFYLVGTMDYGKGSFAFFDGNNEAYRKILERNGTVAGYTVKKITLTSVELESSTNKLVLNVGAQMRQSDAGVWEMVAGGEPPASSLGTGKTAATPSATSTSEPASTTDVPAAEAPAASSDSSTEGNDVLKKLMQKREQELQ